jgi:hypothetical protein
MSEPGATVLQSGVNGLSKPPNCKRRHRKSQPFVSVPEIWQAMANEGQARTSTSPDMGIVVAPDCEPRP